jgi:hypothetical protein
MISSHWSRRSTLAISQQQKKSNEKPLSGVHVAIFALYTLSGKSLPK